MKKDKRTGRKIRLYQRISKSFHLGKVQKGEFSWSFLSRSFYLCSNVNLMRLTLTIVFKNCNSEHKDYADYLYFLMCMPFSISCDFFMLLCVCDCICVIFSPSTRMWASWGQRSHLLCSLMLLLLRPVPSTEAISKKHLLSELVKV